MDLDDPVPLDNFGKDHRSTLAYAETVMVDLGGFQVGNDCRMRQCRRNYRVMRELCFEPRRVKALPNMSMVMDRKYSTHLRDGTVIDGHDDWHCVQDMAEAGFFTVSGEQIDAERVQPGVILHLSPRGRIFAEQLRAHKSAGGTFKNFVPNCQGDPSVPQRETLSIEPNLTEHSA